MSSDQVTATSSTSPSATPSSTTATAVSTTTPTPTSSSPPPSATKAQTEARAAVLASLNSAGQSYSSALQARATDLHSNAAAIDALADELEDRFGPIPEPAARLLDHARLAALARDVGIARVDAGPAAIALTPRSGITLTDAALVLKGSRYVAATATPAGPARAAAVRDLLERLLS